MPHRASFVSLPNITLDQTSLQPLYRQLYNALREVILNGQLKAGARLPASRTLADDFGVSRNTVMSAYAQLLAEGYVEGEVGSWTYVARTLPDELLHARASAIQAPRPLRPGRVLSHRGARLESTRVATPRPPSELKAFRRSIPALDAFPYELWARLMARRWRRPFSEAPTAWTLPLPASHCGFGTFV